MKDLIHVYDRLTGQKQYVPAGWLTIYPNLRVVPSERAPITPAAPKPPKQARSRAAVPTPPASPSGTAAHSEKD